MSQALCEVSGLYPETTPTIITEFNALTSPSGIAEQRSLMGTAIEPFLDPAGQWDIQKANRFYSFLAQKRLEYEQAGNTEMLTMILAVRAQFLRSENDYSRYKDLMQEPPFISFSMDDPRGLALLEMGESLPRVSDHQLFIASTNMEFQNAWDARERAITMCDSNTLSRRVVSIAVERIIGSNAPFYNWSDGYISGSKKEDGSEVVGNSADLIYDYATRSTPIPALDAVAAFITTDGSVYYIVSGGAHRAAAAIMKGQSRIDTKQITFRKVNLSSREIETMGE